MVSIEHFILILKTFIEQSIDDTPDFVVDGERERNAIQEIQITEMKFCVQRDKIKDKQKALNDAKLKLGRMGLLKLDTKDIFIGVTKKLQFANRFFRRSKPEVNLDETPLKVDER